MGEGAAERASCLCLAIAPSKASEKTLSHVVDQISLWQPGGLPFQLHLVHIVLLRHDQDHKPKEPGTVQREVTHFMSQRFLPILDRLPESCDWNLHVVTVTPPVISGDTNRGTHSDREAKYVAAAIVRQAKQIGATEIVVNRHNKNEHSITRKPLSARVIKYSHLPVRVIGGAEDEVHLGKGRDPHCLGENAASQAEVEQQLQRTSDKYPKDKTDAYSSYKRVVGGMKHLLGKGHKRSNSTASQSELETESSSSSSQSDAHQVNLTANAQSPRNAVIAS